MKFMKFAEKVASLRKTRIGKLVYSIIVLAFAATIFATATLAWFAYNDNTKGAGMDVSADTYDVNIVANGYMWDIDGDCGTDKQVIVRSGNEFVRPASPQKINLNDGILMHQYDLIFVERNKYTPFVIRFDVTAEVIQPGGSGKIIFTLNRNSALSALNNDGGLNAYFTNVTKFTAIYDKGGVDVDSFADSSDLTGYTDINDKVYRKAVAAYDSGAYESKTFVTFQGSGDDVTYTTANSIIVEADYNNAIGNGDGTATATVYFVIDYSAELARRYGDENMSLDDIANTQDLIVEDDMSSFVASVL